MTRHLFPARPAALLALSILLASLSLFGCEPSPQMDAVVPDGADAVVASNPASPTREDGAKLSWAGAPLMEGVKVVANRDSAVLVVPVVDGARDYRAFRVQEGTRINADLFGDEDVLGAVVHCAGNRQHNDVHRFLTVMRQVEVTGLQGPTQIVIEAIDRPCPFTGVQGNEHGTVPVEIDELPLNEQHPFTVFTGDEIRAAYGSLIVNGHAPGTSLGVPSPRVAPKVLARTTVIVTPTGAQPPLTGTFFDGFDDDADQPRVVRSLPDSGNRSQNGQLLTNSKWAFYTWGADLSQFFIERGELHSVLADWGQDIFSSNVAIPKRTFALSDTGYLHLHYEVASDTTARRYWWMFVCGAGTAGQTLDANGLLRSQIVQTPFFYDTDGRNPSLAGWSCLQVFPLDGSPFELDPTNTRPESDLRIIVNVANGTERDSVRQVSPAQFRGDSTIAKSWYRQQRGNGGALGKPVLDDQMLISPRTRMDLFVRRDRVVAYVNGEQRVCNDFPNQPLTMAEGAVGFSQVLYHSAAEHLELREDFDDRSGQIYYLFDTPFVDSRTWDNLGVEEGVASPPDFDAGACFVSP
ncbi:MAG TPA: hypothetical protein VFA20_34880 [Myxococcaceae bacterium]|nr:hypothetical protein [Myxococcaceae bacterium]